MKMNLLTFWAYQLFHFVPSKLSTFSDHSIINATPPKLYAVTSLNPTVRFFNFFLYSFARSRVSRQDFIC
jgi:hypothetical protein